MKRRLLFIVMLCLMLMLASAALAEDGPWQYRVDAAGLAHITAYTGQEARVSVPERLDGVPVVGLDAGALALARQVEVPVAISEIAAGAFDPDALIISRHGAEALRYADKNGLKSRSLTALDLTELVLDLTGSDYFAAGEGFSLSPALFHAAKNVYAVYIPEDGCAYQITGSQERDGRVLITVSPWETLLTYERVTITANSRAASSSVWQDGIQVNQQLEDVSVPLSMNLYFAQYDLDVKFKNISVMMDLDTKTLVQNMLADGTLSLVNPAAGLYMTLSNSADCILYMRMECDVDVDQHFHLGSPVALDSGRTFPAEVSASVPIRLPYGFILDVGAIMQAELDGYIDMRSGISSQHIGFEYTSGGGLQSLFQEGQPYSTLSAAANLSASVKAFATVKFTDLLSLAEVNYGLTGELSMQDKTVTANGTTDRCMDVRWEARTAGQIGFKIGADFSRNSTVRMKDSKKWKLFGVTGESTFDVNLSGFHAITMLDLPSKTLDAPLRIFDTNVQSGDTAHFEFVNNQWQYADVCTRQGIERLLIWDPADPSLGAYTQRVTTDDAINAYPQQFARTDAVLLYWYDEETGEQWDVNNLYGPYLQLSHPVDWSGVKTLKAKWEAAPPSDIELHEEYLFHDQDPGASVDERAQIIVIPGFFSDPQAVAEQYMATHVYKKENGVAIPWPDYPLSVNSMVYSELTSLTLGSRVIAVGDMNDSYYLESVSLHEGMTRVGNFQNCIRLKSITLPASNESPTLFTNCYALSSVTLPGTMTEIYDSMFQNCRSLKSIVIPEGVTRIGKYAFAGSGLESITLPSTLKTIDDCAFYGCPLRQITLPEALTDIGSQAFADCPNLKELTIPASVQQTSASMIVDSFFNEHGNYLQSILWKAPRMDANIGGYQLENVTVENAGAVTLSYGIDSKNLSINAGKLAEEPYLGSLRVEASAETIQISAREIAGKVLLSDTPNLKTVEITCDAMGDLEIWNSSVESLIIHCKSMGALSIAYCDSLTNLVVDGDIDSLLVRDALNLRQMQIGPITSAEDSALILDDLPRLETLTLADGTQPQLSASISACDRLDEISLPADVQTDRFRLGRSFLIVYRTGTGTADALYTLSFESDMGPEAESVYLMEGAKTALPVLTRSFLTLGGWYLDQALTKPASDPFEMPAADTTLYSRWIADQENTWNQYDGTAITFLNGPDSIGIIPEGVTSISSIAIWSDLKTVRIPASVTAISDENFRFAERLSAIIVDPGNTHFRAENNMLISSDGTLLAVACNSDAEYLIVPDGVTGLGNYCFAHLGGKTLELQIPDSVTWVGEGIFENISPTVSVYGPQTGPVAEAAAAAGLSYNEYPILYISEGELLGIRMEQLGVLLEPPILSSDSREFLGWSERPYGALIPDGYLLPEGGAMLYAVWNDAAPVLDDFAGHILYLPAGLMQIEAEAFRGIGAQAVVLPEGCAVIGSRAFADSDALRYVHLPASIASIAPDAFDGSGQVTLAAAADSPWRAYAQEHGIRFVEIQQENHSGALSFAK